MEKKVKLKDGSEVLIRELGEDDVDRSFAFFTALPEEDRAYLRVDVTKREVLQQRIQEMVAGRTIRLVAVADDKIVADGALDLPTHGWTKHVAELRLIVARPFQRKGLGMLMARELYGLAATNKVEEIIVEMMRPQVAAMTIFKSLGFHQEAILPDYVRDIRGKKQDLVLMRCDLESLWQTLEDHMADSDWQRTR
ncbi:MAG: GNAT family N-acetyltransferase [Candidatus Zixiibacteriota bacterium]